MTTFRATWHYTVFGWIQIIALISLAYGLAIIGYWHFLYWHFDHLGDLYLHQDQLLNGYAPWYADQNRLMAPLLIVFLQKIFGFDYPSAYQHFMFWSIVLLNFLTLWLLRRYRMTAFDCAIGVGLSASLPLLLFNYWWFPWTNLEAILIVCLFLVDSIRSSPVRVITYVGLFLVWVLTKETAIMLPIWLFLRHVFRPNMRGLHPTTLVISGLAAGISIVLTFGIIVLLRATYWKGSTFTSMPGGNPQDVLTFGGTHFLFMAPRYLLEVLRNAFTLCLPGYPDPRQDWLVGGVAFSIASVIAIYGVVSALRERHADLLVISLFAVVYLLICFILINLAESDKLLPIIFIGLFSWIIVRSGPTPAQRF